jgi:hypothetical protein
MRQLLRGAYRLLIRNTFIRWTWLLALALYGVKIATDRGFAWKKTVPSKTIFAVSPSDIESFTIQNAGGEDVIFSRQDSVWIAVKNNIIVRLPDDSVRVYLDLFSKIERLAVKTVPNVIARNEATEGGAETLNLPKWRVSVIQENGVKSSLSIHYAALDSLSNENLTFLKLGEERLLHGVRGDWMQVLGKNFDDFRDRRLLSFSLKEAAEMSFQNPTDTLNAFRKDTTWRSPYNRLFNPALFKNHVDNLAILRGSIFYDEDRDLLVDRKMSNRLIIKTPTDTAVITAFRLDNYFVVHSTCNPDNYFKMEAIQEIFFR